MIQFHFCSWNHHHFISNQHLRKWVANLYLSKEVKIREMLFLLFFLCLYSGTSCSGCHYWSVKVQKNYVFSLLSDTFPHCSMVASIWLQPFEECQWQECQDDFMINIQITIRQRLWCRHLSEAFPVLWIKTNRNDFKKNPFSVMSIFPNSP